MFQPSEMDGHEPWGRFISVFVVKVLINSLTMSGLLGQYKMSSVKLLLCSTQEFGEAAGWTWFV